MDAMRIFDGIKSEKMDYNSIRNLPYKTEQGKPINSGSCASCKHNGLCKFQEGRLELCKAIHAVLENSGPQTPVSISITCEEFVSNRL